MDLRNAFGAKPWLVLGMALSLGLGIGAGPTVASHLVVRSTDIVNGQVKTADLGAGAVTKAKTAAANRVMWAVVNTTDNASGGGTIVAQSGGISVVGGHTFVGQRLHFPRSVAGRAIIATPITSALGSPNGAATVKVVPCGNANIPVDGVSACDTPTASPKDLLAIAHNVTDLDGVEQAAGVDYYIAVLP